ncbi:MAG: thiol oxidoreductase [Crocinitomicaceae bacterium]|nr:thiol oxidoreductase [Crocinitomicaceae bacterium]
MKKNTVFLTLFLLIVVVAACNKILPGAPSASETIAEPIEGLTDAQMFMFMQGDELFDHVYTAEEGLGPIFIQQACSGCHVGDGKGHPLNTVTRFGKETMSGFDYMLDQGGPQLQQRSINGYLAETLPVGYTHSSDRIAPIVIGMGLLAALHDNTILAMADPFDSNGDGISGRANYIQPPNYFKALNIHTDSSGYRVGRFGKKASKVSLLHQVVFALKEDIGITSDYDTEDLYNYLVGVNTGDLSPDPEVGAAIVDRLVFYMRTLKAPTRRNESDPDVVAGEQIFGNLQCVKCHAPTLTTDDSDISALSQITFHPYTDLLLHDMGALLADGYPEGNASGSEWRTPPLWGLGLAEDSQGGTGFYLHDGRATTLKQAISLHGGEAMNAVNAYFLLTEAEKEQLIKFLKSL